MNKISYSAYTIISHPNVEMTPEFLETYVHIQAQLGRPESLPKVFALYASKRKPVMKDGEIVYVAQNPRSAARAIEVPVASMAVQTAIDTRNLDAALGIIDAAYCVPAFKRQKLLRHASAPAIALEGRNAISCINDTECSVEVACVNGCLHSHAGHRNLNSTCC